MRIARLAVVVAPAVVLLAACSGGSSAPADTAAPATSAATAGESLAVDALQAQLVTALAAQQGYAESDVTVTCDGGIDNAVGATQECEANGPDGAAHLAIVVDAADASGPSISWTVSESSAAAG